MNEVMGVDLDWVAAIRKHVPINWNQWQGAIRVAEDEYVTDGFVMIRRGLSDPEKIARLESAKSSHAPRERAVAAKAWTTSIGSAGHRHFEFLGIIDVGRITTRPGQPTPRYRAGFEAGGDLIVLNAQLLRYVEIVTGIDGLAFGPRTQGAVGYKAEDPAAVVMPIKVGPRDYRAFQPQHEKAGQ